MQAANKVKKRIAMFYDKEGSSITVDKFCDLVSDDEYKVVCQEFAGKYFVSTTWLGTDFVSVYDDPLIFETMVFDEKIRHIYGRRYATLEEAESGHKEIKERYKNEGH